MRQLEEMYNTSAVCVLRVSSTRPTPPLFPLNFVYQLAFHDTLL